MSKRELIIIGAGAAGMMAAAKAAEKGISVLLLEKMEKMGKMDWMENEGKMAKTGKMVEEVRMAWTEKTG